jgi:hypothetical protein
MIYRVLSLLRYKGRLVQTGIAHLDLTPEQETALMRGGHIAHISPPRLDVLPGWEKRAARLAKLDILDALQLLQADAGEAAKLLRIKPDAFKAWQDEIKPWLLPQED